MKWPSFARSEAGQAMVLVAIMTMTLLFAVGLAIDAGQLYVARRTMQEAVDAGAYAGAVVLYQGGTQSQARDAAFADASANGYSTAGDTTVTVNAPPTSGLYSGNNLYLEVIIWSKVRTALVPAQSVLNDVRVRGVAGSEPLNNGYAIIVLDRGITANALEIEAQGYVNLKGGGILVNSRHPSESADNNGTVIITPAPPLGIDTAGGLKGTWPNPKTFQPQRPDPFAGFPTPITAGMQVYDALPGGNPMVLDPGIYNVSLSAAGNTKIRLNTGIYILKNGINDVGNADISSNPGGVFIFNTTTNYPSTGGTCGSIRLVGNGASSLQPLTTGTYKNMLIYQDPACTAQMKIAGNGTLSAGGTIYLPTAHLQFDGNNATLTGSQLVAKTIWVQNGNLTIDFNADDTAQPILPRLAE